MRGADSGITLLEVLISLALMGFIAIGLSSIGRTGSQSWERLDATDNVNDQALARFRVRQQFEALPLVKPGLPIQEILQVQQSGDALILFWGQEEQWSIDWSDAALTFGPNLAERNTWEQLYPVAAEISVTYFGIKSPRTPAQWYDDWIGATLIPQLIKFEVTDESGRAHPPLTIQPGKLERQSEISASSLFPPN